MKRWLRRIAVVMAGMLAFVFLLVVVFIGISYARQQREYSVAERALLIPSDAEAVTRGQHLVNTVSACTTCHAPDLGGAIVLENPLLGRFVAANLTRGEGGLSANYNERDFVRAVRHGVGRDRRPLAFMPSDSYHKLSDSDLASVIAYVRTVAPVDRKLPENRVGPLARVLHVLGFPLFPAERIDHNAPVVTPVAGVSIEFGEYLATVAGCRGCHGPALAGGAGPGPNITAEALSNWTQADFQRALRKGKRPDGSTLKEPMPWPAYSRMSDEEIAALWLYVRSLPAVKSTSIARSRTVASRP